MTFNQQSRSPFSWAVRAGLLIIALLCTALPGKAQAREAFRADRMDTVLYGVAYYPEYMPEDRLEQDVQLMQKAGISVVRIGESSWGLWEPQDGKFEFAWMDRVVERLHAAGIRIILGTPTYSIPAWLYKEHPEIVITRLAGQYLYYGLRQNTDLLNPTYRFYCERVIRKILEHYKNNPDIIGYQIDNETSSGGAANVDVQAGFVDYLKIKFKDVNQLNTIWGLNYWGQRLNDWSEFPPRDGIINPGWKLEWERYSQWLTTDFLAWQAKIVNEYKRPEQFVTHDFAGPPRPEVNESEVVRTLDIAAANPYHGTQDHFDGEASSYVGDYVRSLKKTNYLITETNAEAIGWDSKEQFPPYDGQLRLDVYTHVSSGANMVEYWHWHSIHYGQETYWKGVLGHDLQPGRAYEEVSRTAHELKGIGPEITDFQRKNQVAILYSDDSSYGLEFMKFSDRENYRSILQQMYHTLYVANIGVDFVFPDSTDLADYKVIVVPPLYVASNAVLKRLADYVRGGGNVVMSFKSGFCNEYSAVRWDMAPGPLRDAAGFHYQEFSSLQKPLVLTADPFHAGNENKVSEWAEMLILDTAKPLAYYDHPFFGRYPAITRNVYGKGTLTYEGTVLSAKLQEQVLLGVLQQAGLTGADQTLPPTIRVKHGQNRKGKKLHYFLNYSNDAQTFNYTYGASVDLLTQSAIAPGQGVTLKPWDAAILEEK
ncbi:MAG TPA: beta-galactosidase [Candidatus Dormibacteraeota bacterium]|nr:beta-galactosidase [Candidatus Dormibacteraeota bacterium]